MMHAATLKSKRLARVRALLQDGQPHSTLDIFMNAQVVAVSSVIAELRECGLKIDCDREQYPNGPVFFYTLVEDVEA